MSKFKDRIVLFSGGIQDYIGEIVPSNLGDGWWRIKNPCTITNVVDNRTKQPIKVIQSFHYPQRNFKKFIDIYIPSDSIIEVRTLDKDGAMYKEYKKAIEMVASNLIQMPGGVTIQ